VTVDEKLTQFEKLLAEQNLKIDRMLRFLAPKQPHEDEKIFKDPTPKYWNGESYKGAKLSETPSDYLRALANYKSACAFMARKEGKPDKIQYAERDEKLAALARQWAEYREASGESPAAPTRSEPAPQLDMDSVPF
jgi:hypothetical protein